ncbi:hypothetical protein KAI87_05525 [Myxococcota bacterium]|nr:hypothetical protein [Myxococcota bacterium]
MSVTHTKEFTILLNQLLNTIAIELGTANTEIYAALSLLGDPEGPEFGGNDAFTEWLKTSFQSMMDAGQKIDREKTIHYMSAANNILLNENNEWWAKLTETQPELSITMMKEGLRSAMTHFPPQA